MSNRSPWPRRALPLFLILCLPGIRLNGAEAPVPLSELSPLALAQAELDRVRDDVHKREMKIVWPEAAVGPQNLVESVPENAEVYLINGYISYTCTRLRWRNGTVSVERIFAKRTWFYNAKGESFAAETLAVAPADFARAWFAAQLLIGTKAERVTPEPNSNGLHSASSDVSSHEHYRFVRLRQPDKNDYQSVARGMSRSDDIQDFECLRKHAIGGVFDRLCPIDYETPKGQPLPIDQWNEFLTEELKRAAEKVTLKNVTDDNSLILETALRILGQNGYEPAEAEIEKLRKKLVATTEKEQYRAQTIHEETEFALIKIQLQQRWSPERAAQLIHENPRKIHAQNDLSNWVRGQYFARDPLGYHKLLRDDLRQIADYPLLRETLAELQQHFLGEDLGDISALLTNDNPEVVTDACFILLNPELKSRPDPQPALATLDRIAGDPNASIPRFWHWFEPFGRNQAVEYLISEKAPASARWTAQRVRKQLAGREDGRMVHRLLSALDILNSPASNQEKIESYRRALTPPYSLGTLTACEELAALKDVQSAPAVRKVLSELLAGCNKDMRWKDDPTAKYPWTDKYDLEGHVKRWDKLEKQGAPGNR